MVALFSIILSIICMRYYTGLAPVDAYLHWVESNSVYHTYQQHYGDSVAEHRLSQSFFIFYVRLLKIFHVLNCALSTSHMAIPKSTKRIFLFLCTVSGFIWDLLSKF